VRAPGARDRPPRLRAPAPGEAGAARPAAAPAGAAEQPALGHQLADLLPGDVELGGELVGEGLPAPLVLGPMGLAQASKASSARSSSMPSSWARASVRSIRSGRAERSAAAGRSFSSAAATRAASIPSSSASAAACSCRRAACWASWASSRAVRTRSAETSSLVASAAASRSRGPAAKTGAGLADGVQRGGDLRLRPAEGLGQRRGEVRAAGLGIPLDAQLLQRGAQGGLAHAEGVRGAREVATRAADGRAGHRGRGRGGGGGAAAAGGDGAAAGLL
jgi:hypothetical protein